MNLSMSYDTGKLFFEARDYVTAAGWLAEVVEAEPGHEAARMLLARAYYHSAQLGRAEKQLRHIIDRNPVEAYAYLMLGRTLQRQNRDAEAVRYMRLSAAMTGGSMDGLAPPGARPFEAGPVSAAHPAVRRDRRRRAGEPVRRPRRARSPHRPSSGLDAPPRRSVHPRRLDFPPRPRQD